MAEENEEGWALGARRMLTLDGEPVFELSRVRLDGHGETNRYKLAPTVADTVARRIVALLNQWEREPEKFVGVGDAD